MSPWPARYATAFSEDPSIAPDRLSRDLDPGLGPEGRISTDEAQSSTSTAMPHHLTSTIAEEEQQEGSAEPGSAARTEAAWPPTSAAAATAAASEGGAAGNAMQCIHITRYGMTCRRCWSVLLAAAFGVR